MNRIISSILFLLLVSCSLKPNESKGKNDFLLLRQNELDSSFAYFDREGHRLLGDYSMAFTDTLRDFGIVFDSGFVLIDRKGRHIYDIFPFDNGPDITSEGLYRIIRNGKIGYVDSATATLVIPAIYECAWPFDNGKAKVSMRCESISEGEYHRWVSDEWFYIDKNGRKIR